MPERTSDGRLAVLVLVVVGVLLALPMLVMGVGMLGVGPMRGPWGHGLWGSGTIPGVMLLAWVAMQLLFLAAVVGTIYLLYRAATRPTDDADRALEELRLAYARGELTDEEYERRREALERDT